jgi:hypothetical protein
MLRSLTARFGCFAAILMFANGVAARGVTIWPVAPVPAQINVTSDSAPGWVPTAEQIKSLRNSTDNFLAAKDSSRSADAYALLADVNRRHQSFDGFANLVLKFNRQSGPVTERRIVTITWTKDPVQAPEPGIYAALDIVGHFANIDRYCGYLVLYQSPTGGPFQVMRQEENFIDNATAASIARESSDAAVDEAWAKASANCPGYQRSTVALRQSAPLPEATDSTVGYPTVAAALAALRAKSSVVFTKVGGWTIADDETAKTIWSFPPPGNAAYPAAVKRQIVEKSGALSLEMSVICGATKQACDDLVRSFRQLNAQMTASMQSRH